jgi:hypothetical protein
MTETATAIKASELRIGNWVTTDAGRTGIIDGYAIQQIDEAGDVFDSGFRPIPLTPEILEKCGFEYRENNYNKFYRKAIEQASLKIMVHSERFYFSPFEMNYETELKYLHQLQNLYFALTGNELEINL